MILIIEGISMCFVLLIICVIGITNGPVGLVVFYEQEVKDRVVYFRLRNGSGMSLTWVEKGINASTAGISDMIPSSGGYWKARTVPLFCFPRRHWTVCRIIRN